MIISSVENFLFFVAGFGLACVGIGFSFACVIDSFRWCWNGKTDGRVPGGVPKPDKHADGK